MILVFGATGQLGYRLLQRLAALGLAHTAIDHTQCDFSEVSDETLSALVALHRPKMIINAAAYTAVDAAEKAFETAQRVNAETPAMLASIAARLHVPLVHFSTDYVFDGTRGAPYDEHAKTNPQNRYGFSKLAGEQLVIQAHPGAVIFRLQWLYDIRGRNFLRSMLALLSAKPSLQIVADQLGAPGFVGDIAQAVVALLPRIQSGELKGIYHLAHQGHTSWHGFTCAIAEEMRARGMAITAETIEPITSAEYPLPAARPKDARLNCEKLAKLGVVLPHWRASLTAAMDEFNATA